MKILKIFVFAIAFVSFSDGITMATPKCNQEQAFNKMMALGRVQTRLINKPDDRSRQTAAALASQTASYGQLLKDKKYDEACAGYDNIAQKFGIDLAAESKGMITLSQAGKDGGKKGGKCSQADASKKMMGYFNQLEDRVANGDEDPNIISRFGKDTAPLNELFYTDPSAVCKGLDELKKKYALK